MCRKAKMFQMYNEHRSSRGSTLKYDQCSYIGSTLNELSNLKLWHKSFCETCGKSFSSRSGRDRHQMSRQHDSFADKPKLSLNCEIWQESFSTPFRLKAYIQTIILYTYFKYQCDYYAKSFWIRKIFLTLKKSSSKGSVSKPYQKSTSISSPFTVHFKAQIFSTKVSEKVFWCAAHLILKIHALFYFFHTTSISQNFSRATRTFSTCKLSPIPRQPLTQRRHSRDSINILKPDVVARVARLESLQSRRGCFRGEFLTEHSARRRLQEHEVKSASSQPRQPPPSTNTNKTILAQSNGIFDSEHPAVNQQLPEVTLGLLAVDLSALSKRSWSGHFQQGHSHHCRTHWFIEFNHQEEASPVVHLIRHQFTTRTAQRRAEDMDMSSRAT